MAKALSNMLDLGTPAPLFSLPDVVSQQMISLKPDARSIATVIMFICNHCPYVKHINPELTRVAQNYIEKGVRFFAINSNDIINYPDDSPENMAITAKTQNYPFPYLYDETQEVAQAYHAACTPDFYLFDHNLLLVYRGQFDDARPGNDLPVTGETLRHALDELLAGNAITGEQKPSLGCGIKWKK